MLIQILAHMLTSNGTDALRKVTPKRGPFRCLDGIKLTAKMMMHIKTIDLRKDEYAYQD